MAERICPQCHSAVDPEDRFCPHCGEELLPEDSTGVIPAIDDSGSLPPDRRAVVADLPPGVAALMVRRGPDEGARFVLDGSGLEIGRAAEANIFLDDVTVSRRHALLSPSPQGWVLEDVGSLNGTYVNRAILTAPAVLQGGDEVQIGKYRFVYVVAPPADSAGAGS